MGIKLKMTLLAGLVLLVVGSILLSNYISEHKRASVDLPLFSYEEEKIPVPARPFEKRVETQSPKIGREAENEKVMSEEPGQPKEIWKFEEDDVTTKIEKGRGADKVTTSPPTNKTVLPIPIFDPITSDTGPVAPGYGNVGNQNLLPPPLAPDDLEPDYVGPPAPPGAQNTLPPFTPVTDKKGPVKIKNE